MEALVTFDSVVAGVSENQLDIILGAMKRADEAPRNAVWVLYGEPGSGRTATAASLGDNNIILTCEKGYTSLQNTPDLAKKTQILELSESNSVAQIEMVVDAINAGQIECDNLILDTLSGIYERKVYQSLQDPKHRDYPRMADQPGINDYGWAFQVMRPVLFKLSRAKCMVTIIAHIRYPNPDPAKAIKTGETATRPDLGKSVFLLLNEECGVIGKCWRDENGNFFVRTRGSKNEVCKSWYGMQPDMPQSEFVRFIRDYRGI